MDLSSLTNRNDIGQVLNAMGAKLGVEVGVAFGENAEVILQTSNLERMYLIDPWNYVQGESPLGYADAIKDWHGCYQYAREKLARFGERADFNRLTSSAAAAMAQDEEFDFVYIDANHMRPMIDNDLRAWWPKVKKGGIFGGHDYHMIDMENYRCEVKAAVDEFFKDKGNVIHVTNEPDAPSWYVIK